MPVIDFKTTLYANDNVPPTEAQSQPPPAETATLAGRLFKLFHFPAPLRKGDDPVCLSALDGSTLQEFGYSEREISRMKVGSFR